MANIGMDDFYATLSAEMKKIGDKVYDATEKGLDNAEKVATAKLKQMSPPEDKVGDYAKKWTAIKAKRKRIVYNTKIVTNKSGDQIPLSNILEYSPIRGKPHIRAASAQAAPEMARVIVDEIKKKLGGT